MAQANTLVILARHGHVEGIDPARFRGRADLPLTSLGVRQAAALRDRIAAEWQPTAIFTSPLGRCVETAAALAQPFAVTPETVPGLADVDYGTWQGLSEAEVHARWPEDWARWHGTPQFAAFPHGESLQAFATRAVNALHAILRPHRGETIAIVAHDSVNRVLLLHALGMSLARYRTLAQAPCGFNVLDFEKGTFTLETLNETGHLLHC